MSGDHHLTGHKRYLVAISDVHLGTDHPTVWYQRHLHEPYLRHVLEWVVAEADHIRELVLLGDIVDFWTYPADEVPPTFAEIAATHPAIFGSDGALAAALDALDGAVTYVPGNHDQGITAAEVASIRSPGGHHVVLHEEVPYLPPLAADTGRIAVAHGHHSTLFNAPAEHGPWAPLPIGYFITRAVSTKWARDLEPGTTVADLPGQGAPNGIDLRALRSAVGGVGARSVAATLVDFVCGATDVDLDTEIVMPDGTTATLRDARAAYADCWSDWVASEGGGAVGHASALRAALADFDGSCLGWFAQRMALECDADLVAMGHTHVPILGLDAGFIGYVNSGFDCPSEPDLQRGERPQQVTFAVIDTASVTAEVWAVEGEGGSLSCLAVDAPETRVGLRRDRDFSCYVEVDNAAGDADLLLVEHVANKGTYVVEPPGRIPAGGRGRFWLQDLVGLSGSDGSVVYVRADRPDEPPIELSYACPTFRNNHAEGTDRVATRSGRGGWREGRVVPWGHPLFVSFELDT